MVSRAGTQKLTDEQIKETFKLSEAEFHRVKKQLKEYHELGRAEFYKKYQDRYDLFQG